MTNKHSIGEQRQNIIIQVDNSKQCHFFPVAAMTKVDKKLSFYYHPPKTMGLNLVDLWCLSQHPAAFLNHIIFSFHWTKEKAMNPRRKNNNKL